MSPKDLAPEFQPLDRSAYPVYNTGMAHLNITMDDSLYQRLKRELPPKRISAFIEDAVRARLRPDRKSLEAAYREASAEEWRRVLEDDWAVTEGEPWPE